MCSMRTEIAHNAAILVVLTIAAVLFLFYPTISVMASLWSLSSYSHVPIVPFVSIALLWGARKEISLQRAEGSALALGLLVLLVLLWLLAKLSLIQALEHVSIWMMLNVSVLAVLGWRAYQPFMPALLYLGFMVPVGTSMIPYLMDTTAFLSASLLDAAGIPNYRSGMFFFLPGGAFQVAEVCSGFAYLNAGICVTTLFAMQLFSSLSLGALYVLVSGIFFVAVNGLRAALIMAIGSATNMKVLAEDHILFGWVLFFLALLLVFFFGLNISRRIDPSSVHQ